MARKLKWLEISNTEESSIEGTKTTLDTQKANSSMTPLCWVQETLYALSMQRNEQTDSRRREVTPRARSQDSRTGDITIIVNFKGKFVSRLKKKKKKDVF